MSEKNRSKSPDVATIGVKTEKSGLIRQNCIQNEAIQSPDSFKTANDGQSISPTLVSKNDTQIKGLS